MIEFDETLGFSMFAISVISGHSCDYGREWAEERRHDAARNVWCHDSNGHFGKTFVVVPQILNSFVLRADNFSWLNTGCVEKQRKRKQYESGSRGVGERHFCRFITPVTRREAAYLYFHAVFNLFHPFYQ